MNFIKDFDWSFKSIAKVGGIFILGVIGLTLVISLFSFAIRTAFDSGNPSYNNSAGYRGNGIMMESADMMMAESSFNSKMIRPPMPPGNDYATGSDAEDFEIKEYNGTIKTRRLEDVCNIIGQLKSREDVIFETADQSKKSCYFRFKVEKAITEEIVTIIEALKPESFSARIQTIKKMIEGYDDELDILTKKLASIEETLTNAQSAYDELTRLATRKSDVESLTKIIDSKLKLIEKLSNERLNTKERIDRLSKSKAEQVDRLNYTFFNIHVNEDLLVDFDTIKDSWRYEVKRFVSNFNEMIQGVTVHLMTYILRFIQVMIYFFLSLFLLKGVWFVVKRIWNYKM